MSGQAGRYQRSAGGMVGAMVVMVVLLVAWVGFRSLTTQEPDNPVKTVDYAQVVGAGPQGRAVRPGRPADAAAGLARDRR